jgi:hypothetical protein
MGSGPIAPYYQAHNFKDLFLAFDKRSLNACFPVSGRS